MIQSNVKNYHRKPGNPKNVDNPAIRDILNSCWKHSPEERAEMRVLHRALLKVTYPTVWSAVWSYFEGRGSGYRDIFTIPARFRTQMGQLNIVYNPGINPVLEIKSFTDLQYPRGRSVFRCLFEDSDEFTRTVFRIRLGFFLVGPPTERTSAEGNVGLHSRHSSNLPC